MVKANVETRRDEYTFLGSGYNNQLTEHIFYERRLDHVHESILSRSGRATWRAMAHDLRSKTGHSAVKQKIDSLKNTHLWVVVARARARAPPAELFWCLREQGRVGGEQHEYVARRPPGVRAQPGRTPSGRRE